MLATWLSGDDLASLVKAVFQAPRVGYTMVYGASANKEQWWDNSHAAYLGWEPQDSAEQFRTEIEAATEIPDPNDPAVQFQGGGFAASGHYDD